MYCDAVDINSGNVINLAYLSDKYLFHRLKDQCIQYFSQHVLTCGNAVEYAALDQQYIIPEIQDTIMLLIQTFPFQTLEGNFDKLRPDTLRCLLEKDFLNAPEYEMFRFCLRWAAARCIKTKDLSEIADLMDLLKLIRFPVMEMREFATVSRFNLLSTEDICKVFRYISDKGHVLHDTDRCMRIFEMDCTTDVPFNCIRRSSYRLYRDYESDIFLPYSFTEKGREFAFNILAHQSVIMSLQAECRKGCLVISTQKPVASLLSFRLQLNEVFCLKYRDEGVQVKVTITGKSEGRVQSQYTETLNVSPTDSPRLRLHYHEARLQKKVFLMADCMYEVLIECENTLYYYSVDHCGRKQLDSSVIFSGLKVHWPQTKKSCKAIDAVADLIHGISYVWQYD